MNTLRTLYNRVQVLTVIQIESGFSALEPNSKTANLKLKMRIEVPAYHDIVLIRLIVNKLRWF